MKLEGVFGYCTYTTQAPHPIIEACYIQASRIFKRKDSPYGVAGKSDLGEITMVPRLDVDVKSMLDPYVKHFKRKVVIEWIHCLQRNRNSA